MYLLADSNIFSAIFETGVKPRLVSKRRELTIIPPALTPRPKFDHFRIHTKY